MMTSILKRSWNKRLLSMLLTLATVVGLKAQTQDNAIYIYRNDGAFNAFIRSEIIDVEFSKVGIDGITYNDYVVQEFYTNDTIYRIPLAAIDSVSFVQPETKYHENVMLLTEDHLGYIADVDDNSITFYSFTPSNYLPSEGTVLASMTMTEPLTSGFAGRIIKVEDVDNGKKFICEDVGLDDIYERLVYVGSVNASNDPYTRASDGAGDISLPVIETKFFDIIDCSIKAKFHIDFNFCIGVFETPILNILVQQQYDASLSIGSGDALKLGFSKATWMDGKTYYIPQVPGLGIDVKPGWWIKLEGGAEANLAADVSISRYTKLYVDEKSKILEDNTSRTKVTPKLTAGFTAELSTGPCFEVGIVYISKKMVSLDFTAFPGLYAKMDGQLTVNSSETDTGDMTYGYRTLKDTKLEAGSMIGGVSGCTVVTKKFVFNHPMEYIASDDVPDFGITARWPLIEWYNFPEFKRPTVKQDNETGFVLAQSKPSRDLIFPHEIGLVLYDKERQSFVWDTYLSFSTYEKESWNDNNYMEGFLRKARVGKTYAVYPVVENNGKRFPAEPISEEITVTGTVTTGAATVSEKSVTLYGTAQDVIFDANDYCETGFFVSTDPDIPNDANRMRYIVQYSGVCTSLVKYINDLAPNTKYYYKAYVVDADSEWYYGEIKTFTTSAVEENPAVGTPVDLGLPSGKMWASHNIGTNIPEGFGYYFEWGDTKTKETFYSDQSLYQGVSYSTLSAQNVIDENGRLTSNNDAAVVNWGSPWKLPAKEDWAELDKYCKKYYYTLNGVFGLLVVGANGNQIFLPAAGYHVGKEHNLAGTDGYYWFSDIVNDDENKRAASLHFNKETLAYNNNPRSVGFSVRPIYEEEKEDPQPQGDWVNLGLPSGRLWASYNLGGSKPTDKGDVYAWAETSPKTEFTVENYKYATDIYKDWQGDTVWTFSLFNELYNSSKGCCILTSSYDPCKEGRMPSEEDFDELCLYCSFEEATVNGVQCSKVIGPNGNYILFPYIVENVGGMQIRRCYWTTTGPQDDVDFPSDLREVSASAYYVVGKYLTSRGRQSVVNGNLIRPVK